MKFAEEKEYLYNIMLNSSEERKRLTEIYWDAKKRIDEINKMEETGLAELSTKGYFDYHNKKTKEMIVENIDREMNIAKQRIEKEYEKKNEIVPEEEIIKEKHKEPKKRSTVDLDKVSVLVADVLREVGRPMSIKEIHEMVAERSEYNITIENFRTNILRKSAEKNKRITKAMRGYYQYV